MQQQQTVMLGVRLFVMFAVSLGVYQMVNYQREVRNRPVEGVDNSTSVDSNITETEAVNQTVLPSNLQVYATMRLEPVARNVLQQNGIEATIQPYDLKGVDWVYNICVNYGHLLVAMVFYNKFKEGNNEGGRKFKLLILGVALVFGWIYLANVLAIERVAVKTSGGRVLYHADSSFTKEKFDEFVKEHKDVFVTVKSNETLTDGVSAQPSNTEWSNEPTSAGVQVDEQGNVYSNTNEQEF